MRRHRSNAFRLIAVLTAFVTVWCIGCTGFEPLMAHLVSGQAGMTCASDASMSAATMQHDSGQPGLAAGVDGNRADGAVTVASSGVDRGYSCACQSCTSVTPAQLSVVPVPQVAVRTYAAPLVSVSDITRQPLVPPPQLSL